MPKIIILIYILHLYIATMHIFFLFKKTKHIFFNNTNNVTNIISFPQKKNKYNIIQYKFLSF